MGLGSSVSPWLNASHAAALTPIEDGTGVSHRNWVYGRDDRLWEVEFEVKIQDLGYYMAVSKLTPRVGRVHRILDP